MRITILGSALAVLLLLQSPAQAGDAAAGETAYNARGCIGCHGVAGKSPAAAAYPVVGGKQDSFIAGELTRFRSGERQNPTMNAMAAMLSEADIANLAAYLAAQ